MNKLLLLTDENNSTIHNYQNIKTVTINSQHPFADINVIYENYQFNIDGKIIYEKYVDKPQFISLDAITKNDIIPYYSNNIYLKTAFVLMLLGYNDISILNLSITDPNIYYSNLVNEESIFDIIDVYSSKSYGECMNTISFELINDDLCLCNNIKRSESYDRTLYEFLFDDDVNVSFIKKYFKLLNKLKKTPEYLLSKDYKYIYSDLIDKTFINKCNYEFLDISDNVPINTIDYSFLYDYYNFNPKLYLMINPTLNINNNTKLFIHFLFKEQEKYIYNVPENFNFNTYIKLNQDITSFESARDVLKHFINQGTIEERNIFELPSRFNWKIYVGLNNLQITDKYIAENHYLTIGKKNKLLTNEHIPSNFNIQDYKSQNSNLFQSSDIDVLKHYIQRITKDGVVLPLNFDPNEYAKVNPDLKLKDKSDEEITEHFINYGVFENRNVKQESINFNKQILLICHIGNAAIFKKMEHYIDNAIDTSCEEYYFHIVLNIVNSLDKNDINYIRKRFPKAEIRLNNNFGFDIGSFFTYLKKCKAENISYDYVIKIHTKTSDIERDNLIKPILGSVNRIKLILSMIDNDNVGLIGSRRCMYYNHDKLAFHNQNHLMYLINKFGLNIPHYKMVQFTGGTIFWMKFSVLKDIFWDHNFTNILDELNDESSFDWNWYVCANQPIVNSLSSITDKESAYKHYMNIGKKKNLSTNLFHALQHNTVSMKLRDAMIEHAYERFFSYAVEDKMLKQLFIPYESYTDVYNISPVPIIFPQFHQIPENDKFWEENFTEWTLLNKCETNYLGDKLLKPHEDLGQYNILNEDYIRKTEEMFGKYLINTVCYYHYWFKEHKVMYKPIEKIRDEGKPNVNYVIAWANETWSSRWDGMENQILLQQDYGVEENWLNHINYLLTFFKSDNYVIIDNKPLLFIYRPLDIPFTIFEPMFELFNKTVINNCFDGIHLIIFLNNTTNLELYDQYINSKYVSGVMDFNPNFTNTKSFEKYQEIDKDNVIFDFITNSIHNDENMIYDEERYLAYNIDIKIAVEKGELRSGYNHYSNISNLEKKSRIYKSNLANIVECYDLMEKEPKKHTEQLYSTFMGWDNTPRRDITKLGMKPTIFHGSSPYIFKHHIKNMIFKIIKNPNKDINWLIINAWNEWNEQTCLEPSDIHGYKYLEAIQSIFGEYY